MKTTLKILFLFLPFISHSQANLGTGFFGKVGINVGSTTPTERLKVNGTSAFVGLGTFSGGLTATGTVSLPSTTSIGAVSSTELSRLDGVTSSIQTQLDAKYDASNPDNYTTFYTINNGGLPIDNELMGKVGDIVLDVANGSFWSYAPVGMTNWWNVFSAYPYSNPLSFITSSTAASTYAPINNPVLTTNATSPKFTVTGSGYIANGSDVSMGAGSTADIVTYNASGRIMFSTAGSVRATITNAGNFGIGTLAPTSRFEVSGTSSIRYNDGGQADGKYLRSNSTGIASWAFVTLSEVTGLGTSVATFLTTPSSANLAAALTDETGTGAAVFANNSTLTGTTNIATIANTLGANFASVSGSVGIGTVSPASKLHINSASTVDVYARLTGTSSVNGGFFFGVGGANQVALVNRENTDMEFYNNNTLGVTFKASGRVGIGTSSPSTPLHVSFPTTTPQPVLTLETVGTNGRPYINFRAEGTNYGYFGWGAASGKLFLMNYNNASIDIGTNSATRMSVDGSGNVGIGTTSPSVILDINNTGAIKIPVGTDAQRPASPATGMLRVNTTPATPKLEYYNGTTWIQL